MSIELKIKSKHLALEPAIIKHEQRKLMGQINYFYQHHQLTNDGNFWNYQKSHPELYNLYRKWYGLDQHRIKDVRNEARATYLARAYLKGIPYKAVERKTDPFILYRFIIPRVMRMVAKYGPNPIRKYHQAHGIYDYMPADQEKLLTAIMEWCSID